MLRVESKLSRKVILEYKNPQESEGERKKKKVKEMIQLGSHTFDYYTSKNGRSVKVQKVS